MKEKIFIWITTYFRNLKGFNGENHTPSILARIWKWKNQAKTSLCIPLARFMYASRADCLRPCSQLHSQLLSTLGHEGWTEGARSMTAEQSKHHVPLYFPNQLQSKFPLRSKQSCMHRKLMRDPQVDHCQDIEANSSLLEEGEMTNLLKIPHPWYKRPSYSIIFGWIAYFSKHENFI